jgi:hypothetical protein
MSSTGQATSSLPNFQLIINALAAYTNLTGIDLIKNPFAEKVGRSNSPDLKLLQEREKAFEEHREENRDSDGFKPLHSARGSIFTIDAILAMDMVVPQVQGKATKLVTWKGRRHTLRQHYARFNMSLRNDFTTSF